jgi:hypothetical protein
MGIRQSIIGSAAGLAMAFALTAGDTASGQQIWTVPPAAGYPYTYVADLADGNTALGANLDLDGIPQQAFTWTPQNGRVDLTLNGQPMRNTFKISGDGAYLGGNFTRYRVSDGHVDTIANPGNYARRTAKGISGDGSKIMGTATDSRGLGAVTYTWTPQSGTQYLPMSGRFISGQQTAADMSRDGSTIVGTYLDGQSGESRGFVWKAGVGYLPVPVGPDGQEVGDVRCVNSDGTVYASGLGAGGKGIRWSNGVAEVLSTDPKYLRLLPESMSNDGNVIVGIARLVASSDQRSFVWTQSTGTMFVEDYLRMNGIVLPVGELIDRLIVSGDGKSFAGRFSQISGDAFVATIPTPGGMTLVVGALAISRRRSR